MNLLPKYFVIGVLTPPVGVPGGPKPATPDKLTRIWGAISATYGYRRFELSPDGTAAMIVGAAEDDGVAIQPPLLQIRGPIRLTAAQSAEQAMTILKIIAEHLGNDQFFNLGIKFVYHAPAAGKDARALALHKLLSKTEEDVSALQRGGDIWVGTKYVVTEPEAQFTLLVEPLVTDNAFLFLDLDVQFPGPVTLDSVKERADHAERYMTQTVGPYLESLGPG
jgi:hypothetical protein